MVGVRKISEEFGTPVYAYSLTVLRQSIEEIKQLSPVTRYAMKACSNTRILKEMLDHGIKIDAVSVYEVRRAIKAGFRPEDICFAPYFKNLGTTNGLTFQGDNITLG